MKQVFNSGPTLFYRVINNQYPVSYTIFAEGGQYISVSDIMICRLLR